MPTVLSPVLDLYSEHPAVAERKGPAAEICVDCELCEPACDTCQRCDLCGVCDTCETCEPCELCVF